MLRKKLTESGCHALAGRDGGKLNPAPGTGRRRLLLTPGALLPLLGLSACSPLGMLNGIAAIGSRRVAQGQAYGPQARQRFDLYRPEGVAPAGGWPLVVFFYGGTWNSGDRADYRFAGEALADAGMAAMVADYRLYPDVRYPVFLDDSALALTWALRHAAGWGANPRRVVAMGHSAGAYNAAMLALDRRWLAAAGSQPQALAGWVGLAGPYDFLPIVNPTAKLVFDFPRTPADSQPIHHVHAGAPPALLIAAEDDDLVNPVRNTRGLGQALAQAGVAVTVQVYPGLGHAALVGTLAWPLRAKAPVLANIRQFVYSVQATVAG